MTKLEHKLNILNEKVDLLFTMVFTQTLCGSESKEDCSFLNDKWASIKKKERKSR